MPELPYVAPKIDYVPYIVCGRQPVKRSDTRQIVPVWLAKTAPANASKIMLLPARTDI